MFSCKSLLELSAYLILVIGAEGCLSAFDEKHYLRSDARQPDGSPMNYYRLTVNGQTFLSSSRYLSAYFDEKAMNTYFNEISQPAEGRLSPTTQCSDADSGNGTQPLDGNLIGKKLLLILSSNSDAIATGIGSLAQSDDVTNNLTRILGNGRFKAAADAKQEVGVQKAVATSVVAEGTSEVTGLPDSPTQARAQEALLNYANRLAAYLGHRGTFSTLDQANQWVRDNGSRAVVKE